MVDQAADGAEPGAESGAGDEAPRRDDGLDLARALTRATAGSTPAARKRRRTDGSRPGARRTDQTSGDRDPQLVGSTLDKLVSDRGWELELRVRSVFARWSELVGEHVGDHSTPESFADGKLVVRTDSTAWATELKLLAPALVRRLNDELGEGTVTVIDILGPHGPSWQRGRRSTRGGRGPRDTYG